jgi:RNA polymerase sigma factor (sigma-70 family)
MHCSLSVPTASGRCETHAAVVPRAWSVIGEEFPRILEDAAGGHHGAIEAIYRDTAPVVMGYLRASGAISPEDLTGDVYVDALRGLKRFSGTEHQFRSWLLTIAHRRLVDDWRRRGRRMEDSVPAEHLGELNIDLTDGEAEAMSRLRARGVLEAIEELTEDQRSVLYLRVIGDLPVLEVARILGKPETAIKALQRRAVARLRRLLEEAGEPSTTLGDE